VTVKLVAGDSGPNLTLSLTDKASGQPIDLTGFVSASFKFRAKGGITILATIALTLVGDPTAGQLLLVPTTQMLTQPAGFYEGEVDITLGSQLVTGFDVIPFYLRARF